MWVCMWVCACVCVCVWMCGCVCASCRSLVISCLGTAPLHKKWSVFSGPYFLTFGLNTERYFLYGQEYQNRDQNNSEYGHFSHSARFTEKYQLEDFFKKIAVIKTSVAATGGLLKNLFLKISQYSQKYINVGESF